MGLAVVYPWQPAASNGLALLRRRGRLLEMFEVLRVGVARLGCGPDCRKTCRVKLLLCASLNFSPYFRRHSGDISADYVAFLM
jgi:hypothetical protein